jgi:hypothetical protein
MSETPRKRRVLRRLLFAAGGLLALLVVVVAIASVVLRGALLGSVLTGVLKTMPGRFEVGSVDWNPRIFVDVITDRPTELEIDDVKLWDPEGTLVLSVPHLEVKIPPRSAIGGKVRLHELKVGPGAYWRFAELKRGDGIGFVKALIPPPKKRERGAPPPPPAPENDDGFVLQIVHADLNGFTAQFDFPGVWGLLLKDIKGEASFIVDGDFLGWDAWGLDARQGGFLMVLDQVLPFDRVQIARVATTRDWKNDIFLEVAAGRTGRSVLTGKGSFTHIHDQGPAGIDLHVEIAEAADALAAVAARHQIPGLVISGDGAKVVLDLKEPFERIAIDGKLSLIDAKLDQAALEDLGLEMRFVADPLSLVVNDLGFKVPAGGSLQGQARLAGDAAEASLVFDRLMTTDLVPPGLRELLAGRLDGRLGVKYDLARGRARADIPSLALARRRAGGLPPRIRLQGSAVAQVVPLGDVETRGLTVTVPGATARVLGQVALARQLVDLSLSASAEQLPRVLAAMGIPPIAEAADLQLSVSGGFTNPAVKGQARVRGVGAAQLGRAEAPAEVTARFDLRDGVARLQELSGEVFGGRLAARGQARLYRGSIERMLAAPVFEAEVNGRRFDLARIGGLFGQSLLSGSLSFDANARGTPRRIEGNLTLPPGTVVRVMGQTFSIDELAVMLEPGAIVLRSARITRAEGGALTLTGRLSLGRGNPMHWKLEVERLPLAGLPGIADAGIPIAGFVGMKLAIDGTPSLPVAAGALTLTGVEVADAKLGAGRIEIAADATGLMKVTGRLFERIALDAMVKLTPAGPDVRGFVVLDDIVLTETLPNLAGQLGLNAAVAGRIDVALAPAQSLAVTAVFRRLEVTVQPATLALFGGVAPALRIRNQGDVRVALVGQHIALSETVLTLPGGTLTLAGALDLGTRVLSARVRGNVDLELARPLLRQQVDQLSGALRLQLDVDGRLPEPEVLAAGPPFSVPLPRLEAEVAITRPVTLRLRGLDLDLGVPSGVVRVKPDAVELGDLVVRSGDSSVTLRGRAGFDERLALQRFAVSATGTLDARIFSVVAADAVTEATGKVHVRGRFGGTIEEPSFDAELRVDDVSLRLRQVGRRIRVVTGNLRLTSRDLVVRDLKAEVDEQGTVTIGLRGQDPGRIVFDELLPELKIRWARIPVQGEHLDFRQPEVFVLDDLAFQMVLEGNLTTDTTLSGDVRVVSGRFVQDFEFREVFITPRLVEGGVGGPPSPFLETLRLDLRVRTTGDTFVVRNNLAPEFFMVIDLHVAGTAARPALSGALRPTDGRFRIPGLRGDFDLVPGANAITFVATKSLDDGETPELLLEAQNLVQDNTGTEHNVRLLVRGPIGQASIEFFTDTGLGRNQTLLLLLTGQVPTNAVALTASNPTLRSNVAQGFEVTDQVTRDLVDNMVQPYINNTLKLITGNNLNLRPTIGPEGLELRLFGQASRQLRFQFITLLGFQNNRRIRGEAGFWLADFVTLRGFYERLTLSPQQGITETFNSFNLELSLDYPLRFPRP